MKAKLIKVEDVYRLVESTKHGNQIIATSDLDYQKTWSDRCQKLSKQNCDEIFGVTDVEKIADRHTFGQRNHEWKAYVEGFNKAMELNKDKMFTLEQMHKAIRLACSDYSGNIIDEVTQQPSEIEVEIEMEWITTKTFCDTCNKVMYPDYRCEDKTCFNWQPKLDSSGCLILKRVVC
jgi:hypothetical protein